MLTVDKLREYGANVDEALQRCMGNADFYIMLVNKSLGDEGISRLEEQIGKKDLEGAFETAHALKGMYTNLSLDPLSGPVCEMTELLRNKTDTDYSALIAEAKTQYERLKNL